MRARVLERDDRWVIEQRATLDAVAVHDERREAHLARSHARQQHLPIAFVRDFVRNSFVTDPKTMNFTADARGVGMHTFTRLPRDKEESFGQGKFLNSPK